MRAVRIIHQGTGEVRTLDVIRFYPREIEVRWPLLGGLRFHSRCGKGACKRARMWRIAPDSLAELHKALAIEPLPMGPIAEPEDGQTDIERRRTA